MAISFLWPLIIQDQTIGDSLSWDYKVACLVSEVSDFEEYFVPVQKPQEQPLDSQDTNRNNQRREQPRVCNEARKEELGNSIEVYESLQEVNRYGIDADHDKEYGPLAVSLDVDYPIEQGQQYQAEAAREKSV